MYNENGDLIVDQKLLAKKYARGWFFLDSVSCFPVSYIELIVSAGTVDDGESGTSNLKLLKAFRLLRLAKLLRLARITRLLQRLEDRFPILAQWSRVLRIVLSILIAAHFVACAWHWVSDTHLHVFKVGALAANCAPVPPCPSPPHTHARKPPKPTTHTHTHLLLLLFRQT